MGIGFLVSIIITLIAFSWKTYKESEPTTLYQLEGDFEALVEFPMIQPIVTPSPPPPPRQPVVVEVPDKEADIVEEEVVLDTEITEELAAETPGEEDTDEVFVAAETQAMPVGGMEAFYDYVYKNIRYPPAAQRAGIEGSVYLHFIIDKDGSIKDVKVLKGISSDLDEEAVKVVSQAPPWHPGTQGGKPIKMRILISIPLKIE
ncbi:MAG: energy transducer TonB [Cytophagales bacterium]|nr:energy transducer TonB [Cytophagales bacterium]